MKNLLRCSVYTLFFSFSTQVLKAPPKPNKEVSISTQKQLEQPVSFATEKNTRGLLIFLDDSEKNSIGAITNNFADAFNQEAAPIIVSASVINTLRTLKNNNLVTALQFDSQCEEKWILKEINDYLYLLLPKSYLLTKGIDIAEARLFTLQASQKPWQVEQQLGLKVNTMMEIKPSMIKNPPSYPEFANYFTENLSKIFVTNSEYPKQNKNLIPLWSIYITGHGMMNHSICYLSVDQFKTFLHFLEKIKTRILVYESCYAAGTNAKNMYEDLRSGVTKTYSFPIITTAITDAPSAIAENRKNFKKIALVITDSDIIRYDDLNELIAPTKGLAYLRADETINTIPQIKYPGLEWFSVIDTKAIASIGSVMAKTRKKPLDIAKFFPHQKGAWAQPRGILLYSQTIPFELIINTNVASFAYIPKIISMIPGDAVHFIKKISSDNQTVDALFNAFYINYLAPHKVCIIDEITALFSPQTSLILSNGSQKKGTLTNVIINSEMIEGHQIFFIGFTYNGTVYLAEGPLNKTNTIKRADTNLEQLYFSALHGYKQKPVSEEETLRLAKMSADKAKKLFAKEISIDEAIDKVEGLLHEMPNNSIIRIPQIITIESSQLINLATFRPINMQKILWIESAGDFANFIIDVKPQQTTLFYSKNGIPFYVDLSLKNSYGEYKKDYTSPYQALLNTFNRSGFLGLMRIGVIKKIGDSPIQELLSPEAITSIEAVQKKKILDTQKRRAPKQPLSAFVDKRTSTPPPTQPLPHFEKKDKRVSSPTQPVSQTTAQRSKTVQTPPKTPLNQYGEKATAIAELQIVADSIKDSSEENVKIPATTLATCKKLNLLDPNDLTSLEKAITAFNTKKGRFKQINGKIVQTLLLKAIEQSQRQR